VGFEHINIVFVKSLEPTITLEHNSNHKRVVSGILEHVNKLFDRLSRPNNC
jgi:hypothetical protein